MDGSIPKTRTPEVYLNLEPEQPRHAGTDFAGVSGETEGDLPELQVDGPSLFLHFGGGGMKPKRKRSLGRGRPGRDAAI